MKNSLFLLLFLCFIPCVSQTLKIDELTLDDYLSDLSLLNQLIKKQHPNPYKIISKKEQLKEKKQTIALLKKMPSYPNFLKCINRIGDGHLAYGPPDEFTYDMIENSSFFPFPVFVKDHRIFTNIKSNILPYGTEITKIQNITTQELVDRINKHIHGDNYNVTKTASELTSSFPLYFSNLIERNPKTFKIEYLDIKTKNVKTITLSSIDYYELYRIDKLSILPINKLEKESTIHPHYYKEKKFGVLTVNSFDLTETYAYNEFSKFFKRVNKEKYNNIAIDLRNNEGGNPNIAALLFSFITDSSFKNVFNYRASSIKIEKENLLNDYGNPAGEDEVRGFENFLYQRFNETKDSLYIGNDRLKEGVLENFPADKDNFKGNVYLIVGGQTFSAAVYFAKLFKDHNRGKTIGEETGGNENSTFAGYFLTYKLPKTKLQVRIPITELFFDKNTTSKHGIIPDNKIPLQKYLEYSLLEKDPEIQFLFDMYLH